MAITQVSLIPEAGRRGVDARDTFVTKQEAFQDSLNSSFIPQFNNMATDIQSMAEFSVFSNPVWEAKAYTADYSVNYNGNCYISTEATLATDVPSVSPKWKQTNASDSGADIQVFTSSGTWTKPQGAKMVRIMLVGGGGGGASGALTGSSAASCGQGGAGGGGGGTLDITVQASILNSTQSVIIGDGGLGGVGAAIVGDSSNGNCGQNGSAGGNTVFSSFTAYGGNYGHYGSPNVSTLVYTNIAVNNGGNSLDEVVPTNIGRYIYKLTTSPTYGGNFLNRCSYFPYEADTYSYNAAMFSSIYGGCTTAGQCAGNTAPYYFFYQQPSYGELCSSIYGGASGGHGGVVYLSAGSSGIKTAHNSYIDTKNSPKKFLPSLISSSYTSVGGNGGSSSTTGAGTAGTNATGYGAGGGGGGSSLWGQTNQKGGNGSPGIAIIISW